MHVGNLRTALYAYFYAKQHQGDYILRIEDTDTGRYVQGAVEKIYQTLAQAGIVHDEGPDVGGNYGPYVQSDRKPIYETYAEQLVKSHGAYYCFCDKERLAGLKDEHGNTRYDRHCLHLTPAEVQAKKASGQPYVIRQRIPDGAKASFDDLLYGHIEVDAKEIEDQILLKSDKMPTYNFANVIDDHLMGITHVIRGNEYISSTPKYNLLYEAYGWQSPVYIHLSPILRDETHKLSKRTGDANFEDFILKGYLPQAIVNYICLLGWAPKENREKFTLRELIEAFSIDGLKKSGSIFDVKKLQWLNGEYLKELAEDEYIAYLMPYMQRIDAHAEAAWYRNLALLFRDRLLYGAEMVELYKELLEVSSYTEEAQLIMQDPSVSHTIDVFVRVIDSLAEFNQETLKQALKQTQAEANVKGKLLYMPLRIALTSHVHGPDFIRTLLLFGKEEVLRRLRQVK
jgi:glutamyl-tRNA synthetase